MSNEQNAPVAAEPEAQVAEEVKATEQAEPVEKTETPEPAQETAEEIEERRQRKIQRRIDQLTRRNYELQARLEVAEKYRHPAEQAAEQPEQGDDIEALLEQKLAEREAKKHAESFYNKSKDLLERAADEGDFDIDDFIPVPKGAADAIVELDNPKIFAYLQKHPAEIDKLAALSPARQAVEIGKLDVKLSQPVKKTAAPSPIKPVAGGNTSPGGINDNMSTDEWIKERNRQLYSKR